MMVSRYILASLFTGNKKNNLLEFEKVTIEPQNAKKIDGDNSHGMQNEKQIIVNRTLRKLCHDLNQKIQAIAGYCSLLRMDISKDSQLFKNITQIENQAYITADIVNKIMDTILFTGKNETAN